jgi:hypothetical protein
MWQFKFLMAVPLFLEFSGKAECRATFQFSRLFTWAGTNGKPVFVAEKIKFGSGAATQRWILKRSRHETDLNCMSFPIIGKPIVFRTKKHKIEQDHLWYTNHNAIAKSSSTLVIFPVIASNSRQADLEPVLRIHDILVLIRIRGSGSGIHASDYWIRIRIRILDPNPAIFVIDLQDANKKLTFKTFLWLLLFEGTLTSFFKDKKSKESQ